MVLCCSYRSQPLLRVEATMTFKPKEVERDVFECREKEVKNRIAGKVTVCLRVSKSTRDQIREGETWEVRFKRINKWLWTLRGGSLISQPSINLKENSRCSTAFSKCGWSEQAANLLDGDTQQTSPETWTNGIYLFSQFAKQLGTPPLGTNQVHIFF